MLSKENIAEVAGKVFTEEEFTILVQDLKTVIKLDYECPEKPTALTYGTFWKAEGSKDINAIESYITKISNSDAFKKVTDGAQYEGAEWWWQEQDPSDEPKEFHTDCDLHLLPDESNCKVHPAVSSVFYCSQEGGPTCVYSQEMVAGDLVPAKPEKAVLSFPEPSKLLLFHGTLWHGVLAPLTPIKALRLTLLVNWWPKRPNGPCDPPPSFATLNRLGTEGGALSFTRPVHRVATNEDAFLHTLPASLLTQIHNGVVELHFE